MDNKSQDKHYQDKELQEQVYYHKITNSTTTINTDLLAIILNTVRP